MTFIDCLHQTQEISLCADFNNLHQPLFLKFRHVARIFIFPNAVNLSTFHLALQPSAMA
jgi:hypothetical protein